MRLIAPTADIPRRDLISGIEKRSITLEEKKSIIIFKVPVFLYPSVCQNLRQRSRFCQCHLLS
jgi:hypothetical protein